MEKRSRWLQRAQLRALYAFVKYLALSKGDLVRIEVPYMIPERGIIWDYSNLRVGTFREVWEGVVKKAVDEALKLRETRKGVGGASNDDAMES
jgi:hypothetical protein